LSVGLVHRITAIRLGNHWGVLLYFYPSLLSFITEGMLVKAKDAVKQSYGLNVSLLRVSGDANSNIDFVSRFAQGFGR